MADDVIFLGTRGTISVDNEHSKVYGGTTSCVLARIGGQTILLDAGTGILAGEEYLTKGAFSILLTHPHFDHFSGLPAFSPMFKPETHADIYGKDRNEQTVREQLCQFMAPPLWPVTPDAFSPNVRFLPVTERFFIGEVEVLTSESNHPGGTTHYRLNANGKSIVYAMDFEHNDKYSAQLAEFAADCDLLVYDAQYSDEEYERHRGWGHSTWNEGIKMAKQCNAKRLVLTHHAPSRSDSELSAVQLNCDIASFAKIGERIVL
ncbi:MAG: MBL fold metallo-hydrolase [Oscillospiraceae bacterium]|jgi:phosphoribosyl 1,2-cyclic phosphodiesterase|nr:MBL fold metallo-hydrolase [Oscillospiraceae bacterium]